MLRYSLRLVLPLAAAIALLTGCAGGSERFPSLALRDFERVQGSFGAPDSRPTELRPAPLGAAQANEVTAALEQARSRHQRFLSLVDAARGNVVAAAGTGPEDRRWALAQVEIAELDSRRAGTAALLADLDRLYADASLSFAERDQVERAQTEVGTIVAAEG
ncbi:MAG: hypothetical protein ACO25F_11180, partial [Erythrobacter sp.]